MKSCETCQLEFPDSFKYCRNCGRALPGSFPSTEVIYCPHCGAQAKATWRFCRRCGSEIEVFTPAVQPDDGNESDAASHAPPPSSSISAPAAKVVEPEPAALPLCRRCHTPLRPRSRYCDMCGNAVHRTEAQPAPRAPEVAEEVSIPAKMDAAPTESAAVIPADAKGASVLEAIVLTEGQRKGFNRVLMVALAAAIVVAAFFLIRALWLRSEKAASPSASVSAGAGEAIKLFPVDFSVERVEKEDRYAGGRPHALVKLNDQALFMIRDEGRFSSTFERAQAIAANLRRAMTSLEHDPQADFRWELRAEGPTIVLVTPGLPTEPPLPIVTIHREDVIGYIRRSQRKVKAKQLAQWWLNRLKDRVSLFVKGQKPSLTLEDEDGQLLAELYERAKTRSPDGRVTKSGLTEGFQSLKPGKRRLLSYKGARVMPRRGEGS